MILVLPDPFGPYERVCKHCDAHFELEHGMEDGDLYSCEECGEVGMVKAYPCPCPKKNCKGVYFGINWDWEGIDNDRSEGKGKSSGSEA